MGGGPTAQDPREGGKGLAFIQNEMGAVESSVHRHHIPSGVTGPLMLLCREQTAGGRSDSGRPGRR